MSWLKYRHKWASGARNPWQYVEVCDDYYADGKWNIVDIINDLGLEVAHSWSEDYRGVEGEVVDFPPNDALKKIVEDAETRALSWKHRAERLRRMLTLRFSHD